MPLTRAHFFALLVFVVFALAVWPMRVADAALTSTHYKMELEYSQDRLERVQCNGDSVPITVRVTRISDGSPVVGATVTTDAGVALTNRRGVARALEIAEVGAATRRSLFVSASVDGEGMYALGFYSCPFPAGEFGLTVHAFVDRDRSGAVDRHEQDFANRGVRLGFASGQSQASNIPSRIYEFDRRGAFSTSLPIGSNPNPGYERDGWSLCLTDREMARGWRIVSFKGASLSAPDRCTPHFQLAPGNNTVNIGVARTDPSGPE